MLAAAETFQASLYLLLRSLQQFAPKKEPGEGVQNVFIGLIESPFGAIWMQEQPIYMFVIQVWRALTEMTPKTSAEAQVRKILCKTQSFLLYPQSAALNIAYQPFN